MYWAGHAPMLFIPRSRASGPGGYGITYRSIDVRPNRAGSPWYHGSLGGDLLKAPREVTLDFNAMTFSLR